MSISKIGIALYLILVSAHIVVFTTTIVSGQCQGNFQGLIQHCAKYVQKQGPIAKPSQDCCDVVKNVDLPCVCQHVTSQAEQIISMEKAAFVAQSCGRPLPRGTKCGSYTVPNM